MQQNLGPEARIQSLDNGSASKDGLKVTFNIVTADGKSRRYWMADDDLEKIVSYIIGLSQHAASVSGKMQAPTGEVTVTANPIEGAAVSVVPGRTEMEGMLAVHLGTFLMTFALPASTLQFLHHRLGQMLHPTEPRKSN